jgi:hypothetical protein
VRVPVDRVNRQVRAQDRLPGQGRGHALSPYISTDEKL